MKEKSKRTLEKADWVKIRLRLPNLDLAKTAVPNTFYVQQHISGIWVANSV